MTPDVNAMVIRVITNVFDGNFVTKDLTYDDPRWIHGVEVVSRTREDRAVRIRVGRVWMDAFIPELGVGAAHVDEDDDVVYQEEELTKLCRALRAYLDGGGHLRKRRRLFGRCSTPELAIEVDGFEWRFGRRSWMWAREM
ncbi:hypothetical protein [Agromyces sp. PvR057]|uniref:hypothetical protein n=1 Tax=Agromyces sp. PvR057 TaxID=3156403 RepID=UPI003394D2D5